MTDEQAELLMSQNPTYMVWRRLDDQSVAMVIRLVFTQAICLGVTEDSPFTTRRFCFDNSTDLWAAWNGLKSKLDIPEGWIASRGLPV